MLVGYDWDSMNDENRLLEESNRVAAGALFVKFKP
jgi:hypothetical protein